MMTERTVAIVSPDTKKGVVVNVEVVPTDWTNNDPDHLIEYTEQNPAAIGWEVIDGVVIVPPPPPDPDPVA
jgi:hypothetical protein